MTSLFDIKQAYLQSMSIKDYFKTIELSIGKNINVDKLSDFLTVLPYSETKPYLTRRNLIPVDKRFEKIELVYTNKNKINAIVWDISISLSELIEIFGEPIIHNEPYSHSTAFAFKSNNSDIEIIKTRYPDWLTKVKGKDIFEYQSKNNQKTELKNPQFKFIQIDIKS